MASHHWTLVADNKKAIVIRQIAPDSEGNRLLNLTYESDAFHERDFKTDDPGRSFSSHDARRSAMEVSTDPVFAHQTLFAKAILDDLQQRYERSEFNRLMIVAAPRMLALLRQNMPDALKDCVVGEVDKDLTKMPGDKLLHEVAELWP